LASVLAASPAAWAEQTAEADPSARPLESPPSDSAAASELRLPELVAPLEPGYTDEALAARVQGFVVVKLHLDEQGRVEDVELLQGLGSGLDERALAAAWQLRFRPARRGGVAIPALIRHAFEFRLPELAKSPAGEPEAPARAPAEARRKPVPTPVQNMVPAREDAVDRDAAEVTVQGSTAAQRRRRSAEAVKVLELDKARRESADMGEVLARTQGVSVRRQGGIGSTTRFSLAGLTDEQIRFFIDGVPLELQGYPFGIGNVPINLVDRVEIYMGVVPVRFASDALGGAVNLVTEESLQETHAGLSYEVGSFGSHRMSGSIRGADEESGLFARASGFFDYALNRYPIDVEVPDASGRPSPARVVRFHDDYRANGVNVEAGVLDRPWARRLSLRGFVTDYAKEYQHNAVMTLPYGEVSYAESTQGGSVRYEQPLGRGSFLDVVLGRTVSEGNFLDVAECVYDWYGRCVRRRSEPGETDGRPLDRLYWDRTNFARVGLAWAAHLGHTLRLSSGPSTTSRTGDERRQRDPEASDPLTAQRDLVTLVNGLEYELDAVANRLENVVFGKQYMQWLDSEEPRPGGTFRRRDRDTHRFGVGDAIRYRFVDWLYVKASYEYATRLPTADEVFGDNAFIIANLELAREVSHNGNLGVAVDGLFLDFGSPRAFVNLFVREADDLIVLLGNDRVQSYQNVYSAQSLGGEATLGWTSADEFASLDVGATYQEFRNRSSAGTFANFEGDRLPNRPYLFGSGSGRLRWQGLLGGADETTLFWNSRYVHEFFRGWESIGLRESKQTIASQLVHSAGVTTVVGRKPVSSSTLEVQNLTDEAVFDSYGVQRPGRAFFLKATLEY
jgi:vitamin B12 transporter